MGRLSIGAEGSSYDPDESYRTCSECGGDCEPEPSGADGLGVRIMWVCPQHGVHSVVDPFEHLREQDRRERERDVDALLEVPAGALEGVPVGETVTIREDTPS